MIWNMKFNYMNKKIEVTIQFSETHIIKFEEKVNIMWFPLCESFDKVLQILEEYYNENKIYLGFLSNNSENCIEEQQKEKWYLEFDIQLCFLKNKKQRIYLYSLFLEENKIEKNKKKIKLIKISNPQKENNEIKDISNIYEISKIIKINEKEENIFSKIQEKDINQEKETNELNLLLDKKIIEYFENRMDKKIEESFKNILKPFQQITDIVLEKSGFRKPLDKIHKKKIILIKNNKDKNNVY